MNKRTMRNLTVLQPDVDYQVREVGSGPARAEGACGIKRRRLGAIA